MAAKLKQLFAEVLASPAFKGFFLRCLAWVPKK